MLPQINRQTDKKNHFITELKEKLRLLFISSKAQGAMNKLTIPVDSELGTSLGKHRRVT